MLISLIEQKGRAALLAHIEEINENPASAWGLAVIKRENLREFSNSAFLLAIKPALSDVTEAKLFVLENGDFYISWLGMQKKTYQQLNAVITGSLLRAELKDSGAVYTDPQIMGDELMAFLRAGETERSDKAVLAAKEKTAAAIAPQNTPEGELMKPTSKQKETFHLAREHKGERSKLQILVVEDQPFLRKMLKQILDENHQVETAGGMREGWNLYLEKAPDIVFLDINLDDGNGHTLAQSIRQFDPDAYIVMVTAHNQKEQLETAMYNRVDGYVVKPYNRKQISGYIGKYMNTRRLMAERVGHV